MRRGIVMVPREFLSKALFDDQVMVVEVMGTDDQGHVHILLEGEKIPEAPDEKPAPYVNCVVHTQRPQVFEFNTPEPELFSDDDRAATDQG